MVKLKRLHLVKETLRNLEPGDFVWVQGGANTGTNPTWMYSGDPTKETYTSVSVAPTANTYTCQTYYCAPPPSAFCNDPGSIQLN